MSKGTKSKGKNLPSDKELDSLPESAWSKWLVDFIEVMESEFQRNGIKEDEAFRLARIGTLALAKYHGGRQWYLPIGVRLTTALRDAEIYRRARPGNIPKLAEEFGISSIHCWRVVRQQLKLHRRKIDVSD
jgi:Mor family transcriptional regulator